MPLRLHLAIGRGWPQFSLGLASILSSCVYFLAHCYLVHCVFGFSPMLPGLIFPQLAAVLLWTGNATVGAASIAARDHVDCFGRGLRAQFTVMPGILNIHRFLWAQIPDGVSQKLSFSGGWRSSASRALMTSAKILLPPHAQNPRKTGQAGGLDRDCTADAFLR